LHSQKLQVLTKSLSRQGVDEQVIAQAIAETQAKIA
jgi:hypothetical protein